MTKTRIISASWRLLAIAFTLPLTGPLSAGQDDTTTQKAIDALGGNAFREADTLESPIIGVGLALTQVTDAELKQLAGLKSLQALDLNGTRVTDAGLKELAGLQSLQYLNVRRTKVTDAGLKELAGLK